MMNKCPTFSGRDKEWSVWSFIFESVAAVRESAFTGSAEKPIADLTSGKSADSGPKRRENHGIAAWMKTAVLAAHAPESIRNVVRLAAGPAGGKYRVLRQNMSDFLQLGRVFDKDGRGVESESKTVQVQRRWMLIQSARARERDASCADVRATQRKTASSTKPRARPRTRAKRRTPSLARTLQPSLKASVATVARKVTSGQTV